MAGAARPPASLGIAATATLLDMMARGDAPLCRDDLSVVAEHLRRLAQKVARLEGGARG